MMGGGSGLFTALAGAAIKGTAASAQRKEARKIMQKIGEMPPETIAPEFYENQTLSRIDAAKGLPSEQYNLAAKNIQRNQVGAIMSAQGRRMGGSLIPAIQQVTNNSMADLDARNATARMSNKGRLMQVNSDIGRRKGDIYRNWLQNYYLPNLNYSRALNGAGYQNAIAGLDQGVAGIAGAMGSSGGGSGGQGLFGGGSFGSGGASGSW